MTNTEHVSAGLIRTCFESEHFPALFQGRETHQPALRFIAQTVAFTQDEDLIFNLIKSGLPRGYEGDTLKEIKRMVRDAVKKGFDKRKNKEKSKENKPSAPGMIVEILERLGWTYFRNEMGRPFGEKPLANGGSKVYRLDSNAGELQIKHDYYSATGSPPSAAVFKGAQDAVIAKALFDGVKKSVFLRIARFETGAVYNLANEEQQSVIITESGVTVATASPVAFLASPAMLPAPLPIDPDGRDVLEEFQELLGLDQDLFRRVLAFIIAAFKPEGPYLILMIQGEQGSGKSFLTYVLKTLIDPSVVPKIRLPSNERDLMIQAQDAHLLAFDNLSGLKADMSDALCTLSTGGGYATRRLYANDELQIFMNCRPVILNGINPATTRPDLLDRSLAITLPIMGENDRRPESEMEANFRELLPFLLHEIFRIVSVAFYQFEKVEAPRNIRMIDAGRWLTAAEHALPAYSGALLSALTESQTEAILDSVTNSSLAITLKKLVENGPFEGRMAILLERLEPSSGDRYFPKTAAHLSGLLNRMRKNLAVAGINVELNDRDRNGRNVKVWLSEGVTSDQNPDDIAI